MAFMILSRVLASSLAHSPRSSCFTWPINNGSTALTLMLKPAETGL